MNRTLIPTSVLVGAPSIISGADDTRQYPTGCTDTPFLPVDRWRFPHEAHPRPAIVEPGTASLAATPGRPPSAAVARFDERDQVGRRIAVIANLKPRKMMGRISHGMILAASLGDPHHCLTSFPEETPLGAKLG